jgi:hypothetical protein
LQILPMSLPWASAAYLVPTKSPRANTHWEDWPKVAGMEG